jgi:hypothetical protein
MEIRDFLETLDNSNGNLLFEAGGQEGEKIDPKIKKALEGIKSTWAFHPEGYDLVIMEHDKDGEKPGSWSISFLTEADVGGSAEGEGSLFGESFSLNEEVGYKVISQEKGNFLDIVNMAIEIASNDKYKKGFTAQNLKQLKAKAK